MSPKIQATSILLQTAFLLAILVAQLRTVSGRRKFFIDFMLEKPAVIIDIDFNLTLSAIRDGKEVEFVSLTDGEVDEAHLPRSVIVSGVKMVIFQFVGPSGASCELDYTFILKREGGGQVLSRGLYMTPAQVFKNVQSDLQDIKFALTSHERVDLGNASKAFLCNTTETVAFKKDDQDKKDGYSYRVSLEVNYFEAQAWNFIDGDFNPDPPVLCDFSPPPSDHKSSSSQTAIIAGSVAGGVVLLAIVVIVVVAILRRGRNAYSDI